MLQVIYNYVVTLASNDNLIGDKSLLKSISAPCTTDTSGHFTPTASRTQAKPPPQLPLDILLCIIDFIPASDTKTLKSLRLVHSSLTEHASRELFSWISLNHDLKSIQSKIHFFLHSDLLQYVKRIQIYESAFYTISESSFMGSMKEWQSVRSIFRIKPQKENDLKLNPAKDISREQIPFGLPIPSPDMWMTPPVEFTADVFWLLELFQQVGVDVEIFFDAPQEVNSKKRIGFEGLIEFHLGENERVLPIVPVNVLAEWWRIRTLELRRKGF